MEKILFIINPISERRKRLDVTQLVGKHLDDSRFSSTIKYSEYPGHAYILARDLQKDFKIIIAAGGDGTVNQVSQALTGTDTWFGIIPMGSGNGLARTLKIPLRASKAIQRINEQNISCIDTGEINGSHFVNVAGMGFDALIAHDFAGSARRGFISYISWVIRKFYTYPANPYTLVKKHEEIKEEAFLVSFANSSQYGNNAYISPKAKLDDGLIDVCVMRKFSLWVAPILVLRLFLKNIDRSVYTSVYQVENILLKSSHEKLGHIDGEPVVFGNEVKVNVRKASLNVLV